MKNIERLAVALRFGAAEMALHAVLDRIAALHCDHRHRNMIDITDACDNRRIVTVAAVSVQLDKIIDHMLNIIRTHRALAAARSLYALVSCFRVRHADPLPFFDYVVSRITHAVNAANAIAARIRSPSPA